MFKVAIPLNQLPRIAVAAALQDTRRLGNSMDSGLLEEEKLGGSMSISYRHFIQI